MCVMQTTTRQTKATRPPHAPDTARKCREPSGQAYRSLLSMRAPLPEGRALAAASGALPPLQVRLSSHAAASTSCGAPEQHRRRGACAARPVGCAGGAWRPAGLRCPPARRLAKPPAASSGGQPYRWDVRGRQGCGACSTAPSDGRSHAACGAWSSCGGNALGSPSARPLPQPLPLGRARVP